MEPPLAWRLQFPSAPAGPPPPPTALCAPEGGARGALCPQPCALHSAPSIAPASVRCSASEPPAGPVVPVTHVGAAAALGQSAEILGGDSHPGAEAGRPAGPARSPVNSRVPRIGFGSAPGGRPPSTCGLQDAPQVDLYEDAHEGPPPPRPAPGTEPKQKEGTCHQHQGPFPGQGWGPGRGCRGAPPLAPPPPPVPLMGP